MGLCTSKEAFRFEECDWQVEPSLSDEKFMVVKSKNQYGLCTARNGVSPNLLYASHTNLLKLLALSDTHALWEYAPYTSVTKYVRFTENSEKLVADIAREVLLALQYLHQHNWVHRDIHPDNVMVLHLGEKLRLKLCGMEHSTVAESTNAAPVGTPHFYPIRTSTSRQRDLYALGRTVQFLLSGSYSTDTKGSLSAKEFCVQCMSESSTAQELLRSDFLT